jgi:glutamyl-tRNA synthetase
VHRAGARFDFEKAKWFNQQHLRQRSPEVLVEEYRAGVQVEYGVAVSEVFAKKAIALFLDRAEFVSDLVGAAPYLFARPEDYEQQTVAKKWTMESGGHLGQLIALWGTTDYREDSLEAAFKTFLADSSLGFGAVGPVLRLAIAGTSQGPSIFGVMELIGRPECEARIAQAVALLSPA